MHHATEERTMPPPTSQRTARLAAAVALAAGLAACGGGNSSSPPDPLQPYRTQAVQWAECDTSILGPRSPKLETLWALAGERLRCAMVRAPLDWSNPGRGDVTLAVMRLAAGTPSKRRGALLFNPGGPGEDGLGNALTLLDAFALGNPDSPLGAQQLRLLAEYDMVGFSPRGMGASTQLHCATNELKRFVDYSPAGWDAPDNLANTHYNGRKTAEACQKNPLTPYINTDATARDMDLLRGLLGDDKLNYVGYSYGTWLGAWYASLFPERVGRMVLDSALDFDTTIEKSLLHSQPPARQRLFDEVMVPYAVRHPDVFRLGATEAEVRAIMPRLHPRVQAVLAEFLSGLGYRRVDAMAYLGHIAAAQGLDMVLQSVPDAADASAVGGLMVPQMKKRGYDVDYAVNITSVGAIIATLHDVVMTIGFFAIAQLEFDGVLYNRPMTREQLKGYINRALADPQVHDWFSPRWRVFNECAILFYDPSKQRVSDRRPDRVIYDGERMIVIDFKTGREQEKHKEQVRSYIALLNDMGYKNMEGYLWYIRHHKIVKV